MAWQVVTRAPAQAGNRAGRTEHHLQWWDNSPERLAVTSVADKQRDSSLFAFIACTPVLGPLEQSKLDWVAKLLHACNCQCNKKASHVVIVLGLCFSNLDVAYLLGLLAMIKCSICSYQCDN